MRKLLLPLLAAALLCSPAFAQSEDMEKGFNLGEMSTLANILGMELDILAELAIPLDDITDENYDAGVIDDDDLLEAQLVLAYVMWRSQFFLVPACEAGLDDGSFEGAGLDVYKEDTQAVLNDTLAALYAFDEAGSDEAFTAAALLAQDIRDLDLANRFYELAEDATADADMDEE